MKTYSTTKWFVVIIHDLLLYTFEQSISLLELFMLVFISISHFIIISI